MRKAFWQGFKNGFSKTFWIATAFIIGLALGGYSHPYEKCKRMYDTPDDISECVWILENP